MFLIRHGESEWNRGYRALRQDPDIRDAPLTAEGRRQAAGAAEALRVHALDCVLSSPFTRAIETADIIARTLSLPHRIEPLVCEQFFYSCDVGSPRSLLKDSWPHLDFDHLEEEWWQERGEKEESVLRRAALFRGHMASHAGWRRIAVVSHWAFIRALSGHDAANAEVVRYDPSQPAPAFAAGFGIPASGA